MMPHSAGAQTKLELENYWYINSQDNVAIVPMIHIETKNDWYAEMRYNYEAARTGSLYAGRTFKGGKTWRYQVTPMVGFAKGDFNAVSLAANGELDWKHFYISAENEYCIAARKENTIFFFSWSEAAWEITEHFFLGTSLQYTRQQRKDSWEPGLLAGLKWKTFSFPIYVFSSGRAGCYYVLGINYKCNWHQK